MNDLSLFNSNQSKEFVTTKQLAEILGVDVDTVNNTVRKIGFSDVLRKSTGGRPTQVFNEEQATITGWKIKPCKNSN